MGPMYVMPTLTRIRERKRMKKKLLITIIGIEFIILMISFIPIKNNNSKVLQEVKTENKENNKNTLAIMLRGKDSEEYTPSESNTWPGGDYKFVKAECMDKDGSELNYYSIIDFDDENNTATITTKDTVYCYMYFAEGMNAAERIELYSGKNTPKNATTLEPEQDVKDRGDVLRRFQGTATDVTNNYICFGTGRTDECTQNPDKYMYRIIGYALNDETETNTKKGQVKIVKKEALENPMAWHNNYNENITWFQSDLYKQINNQDEKIKAYLGNTTYVPSGWESKIADHTWWTGDMTYTANGGWQSSGVNVYKIEVGRATAEYDVLNQQSGKSQIKVTNGIEGDPYYHTTIRYDRVRQPWTIHQSAKVGLMNLSDYYLAYGGGDKTCAGNTDCVNTWVHLSKNDPKAPSVHEWLMDRRGFQVEWGRYYALAAPSYGETSSDFFTHLLSVRPVLYLESSVTLNGSGTLADPFIIILN